MSLHESRSLDVENERLRRDRAELLEELKDVVRTLDRLESIYEPENHAAYGSTPNVNKARRLIARIEGDK